MQTLHSKEQFMRKFEEIVEGVIAMKAKVSTKCNDEKLKRNELNSELLALIEVQRKYAAAIKQFKILCEKS